MVTPSSPTSTTMACPREGGGARSEHGSEVSSGAAAATAARTAAAQAAAAVAPHRHAVGELHHHARLQALGRLRRGHSHLELLPPAACRAREVSDAAAAARDLAAAAGGCCWYIAHRCRQRRRGRHLRCPSPCTHARTVRIVGADHHGARLALLQAAHRLMEAGYQVLAARAEWGGGWECQGGGHGRRQQRRSSKPLQAPRPRCSSKPPQGCRPRRPAIAAPAEHKLGGAAALVVAAIKHLAVGRLDGVVSLHIITGGRPLGRAGGGGGCSHERAALRVAGGQQPPSIACQVQPGLPDAA